mgnify:CR=1 FL=1
MKPQTFQHPEIRDENDNIIQPGAFGKNTPFCTKGNDGILDYVANDLEYLYKKSESADNDNLKAKSLAVSGTSDLNLVNADTVKAKSLAVSGTSVAPTAPTGDRSKTIANTEFVQNAVSGLVGAAPETLDTLNELATALGNDPNFATTVSNQIGKKANQTDLTAVSTKVDKKANQTDLEETVSFTNRLQRKNAYKVGEIVYSTKLPSWAHLECTQAGTTAATEPNLSTVTGGIEVNDGSAKFRVVDKRLKAMIDILYPVGIVVTTATDDAKKPGEADGLATWEEIAQDRVLQGTSSGAGGTVEAGLPNITGSIIGYSDRTGFGGADGMAYMDDMQERIPSMGDIFPGNKSALRVRLDASKLNNIYGNSSTVQPPAYKVHFWKRVS